MASTAETIVAVTIVQKAGSPGMVYPDLEAALAEIRELVTMMHNDEVPPETISIRVGTMSQKALDELADFPGY